jgi:hypothetical protein
MNTAQNAESCWIGAVKSMKRQDWKATSIQIKNIKKNNECRASYSEKAKPTEKVEQYFRRKAYEKN